jgi:glycosyltransferase involved in cell wall biosynthesis
MQLSIVIPTYNQGQFIADCIESIVNQSFKDLEVIIQDSMSSDETERICKEYAKRDSRIQYFREKDSGQSDAINRGLKRSTGKYWTWICSDDRFSNLTCLEKLVQAIETKNPKEYVGVFGKAAFISEAGDFVGNYQSLSKDLVVKDFQLTWPLSQPSSILVCERVKEVGGVVESLHLGMDLDLFLKMLTGNYKFLFVDHLVADVRMQDNSKSIKYRKATALNALSLVIAYFGSIGDLKNSDYFKELTYTSDKAEVRKYLSDYKFRYKIKFWIVPYFEKWVTIKTNLISKAKLLKQRIVNKVASILVRFPKVYNLVRRIYKGLI